MNSHLSTPEIALSCVDAINISEKWKARFRLIAAGEPFEKGFPRQYNYGKNGIDWLGFIFGPLYYIYLGMAAKGLLLFSAGIIYGAVLRFAELSSAAEFPSVVYFMPMAAYCGLMAPIDYYKLKIHGQKLWERFSWVRGAMGAALLLIAVLAVCFTVLLISFPPNDRFEIEAK